VPSSPRGTATQLKDVVLNVSQVCNLNCVYCYAVDLNQKKNLMSTGTLDKVLDQIFSACPDGLDSLKFLGGEPTLAFPAIEHAVQRTTAFYEQKGVAPPVFVVVTNGTKLSNEQIDFLSRSKFNILVSLDGPGEIHDSLRPTLGGQGSYDKALDTIRRLLDANCDVAIEAVYTSVHFERGISVSDLMDHFLDLGVREMQITIALGKWHGVGQYDKLEALAQDFASCAKRSIESMGTDDPFLLRGIRFVVENFIRKDVKEHVCGAGRTFMAVNYDGEAYPCYLLEKADTSYGIVGESYDETSRKEIAVRFELNAKAYHEACRKCWANEICQSCLGSSFLVSGQLEKPPTWFCGIQKAAMSATLGAIGAQMNGSRLPVFVGNLRRLLERKHFRARPARIAR